MENIKAGQLSKIEACILDINPNGQGKCILMLEIQATQIQSHVQRENELIY